VAAAVLRAMRVFNSKVLNSTVLRLQEKTVTRRQRKYNSWKVDVQCADKYCKY
jgi:hypothetical protein